MFDTPEEIAEGFLCAWNDHDGDAIASLFAPDADFINVVGFHWRDARSIARAHRRGFAVMFGHSTLHARRVSTRMLGESAAVVHLRWHMTGQRDPAGAPLGDREGIFTFVVERQAEHWVCVAAQNTDVVPGAETHAHRPGAQGTEAFQAVSYLPGQA